MQSRIHLCFIVLLTGAVVTLSVGLWSQHRRMESLDAALHKFQAQLAKAGVEIDDGSQRQHIPLAGVSKGSKKAPVTIVEFSDFQCPFSARSTATLDQLFKEYLGDLRFYFRHTPLPFHPDAPLAAEATLAAEAQGKFWEMHDKLFASARQLQREDLDRYAHELGLDMEKFTAALDSHAYKPRVDQDIALAAKVGAKGTPCFFINGRKLVGAQPVEAFKAVIDEELATARQLIAKGTPPEKVYDKLTASADSAGAKTPIRR
jgi:protein-disulfide isomerase